MNNNNEQDAEVQPKKCARQVADQTMPDSNVPGEAVQNLLNDPEQHFNDTTTNREQGREAYARIQQEGFDDCDSWQHQ